MARFWPSLLALLCCAMSAGHAVESAFTFTNAADRFAPVLGAATLAPWDPDGTGWSATGTAFGTAVTFDILAPPGGDKVVMRFPAATPRQGYLLEHAGAPNGSLGDTGKVSNYTLIFDVLYPAASDGRWRAFYQTNLANTDDAEFYVRDAVSGGIGISGNYRGAILPNVWHRVVITVRAAPGEGQLHKYIDGVFVGAQGTTGSGIDARWALDPQLLLLTEDNAETAGGFLCGLYFTDRQMTLEEVRALGGVNAAGPHLAGAPAGPLPQSTPRLTRAIGHRGASGYRPENTLPAIAAAFADGALAVEIDIRISADGQAVLMHDSTLERTTNGAGSVSSQSVAALQTLDTGSWFDPAYAGTHVPTLVEAMQALPPGRILYLDLKINNATMTAALRQAFNQAGFSEDRWWLYVYDNTGFATGLHAEFPNSTIVWEGLPANWPSDPNAFNSLKAIGVKMFDFGGNGSVLTLPLALRLKQEGFLVSAYTVLDPDNMVSVAARGADLMETDFPNILRDITPPLAAGATRPAPANGATGVTSSVLSWLVGAEATAHRVHFGSTNPPPFVGQQTVDLFAPPALAPASTYFWRIDEVTPAGIVPGEVWNFTTAGGSSGGGALYEWNFDNANLAPSMGAGVLAYADAATPGLVSFGQTNGTSVPHIDGQVARYLRVPAFTSLTNGLALTLSASGPNGGGAFLNRYTFIFDLYSPGAANWQALIQTNPGNPAGNDADWYIAPDSALGIAALGYSAAGVFSQNAWRRIIFSVDLGAGRAAYYLDGVQVFLRTGATGLLDGRFAISTNQQAGPDARLFNEGDTSGVYTHELYLNTLAVLDRELTADEAAALGGARAGGIYGLPPDVLPTLRISRAGTSAQLTWPPVSDFRLQRSLDLQTWSDLPETAGIGNYADPLAPGGQAFYRLHR